MPRHSALAAQPRQQRVLSRSRCRVEIPSLKFLVSLQDHPSQRSNPYWSPHSHQAPQNCQRFQEGVESLEHVQEPRREQAVERTRTQNRSTAPVSANSLFILGNLFISNTSPVEERVTPLEIELCADPVNGAEETKSSVKRTHPRTRRRRMLHVFGLSE